MHTIKIDAGPGDAVEASRVNGEPGGTVKVLIVEDRPDDTELMVRELKQSKLPVTWRAVATEDGYRREIDWRPDIILSDFSLPQFNAFDALRILRERRLDIPLIVVTGTISEEVAVDCIKQGAVDYLLKDRMARLPAALTSALAEHRLRNEKRRTEEQLRDREERLRLALESARMATWDWNLQTQAIGFSDEIGPLFGMPQGKFFAHIDAFLEAVYAEDRAEREDGAERSEALGRRSQPGVPRAMARRQRALDRRKRTRPQRRGRPPGTDDWHRHGYDRPRTDGAGGQPATGAACACVAADDNGRAGVGAGARAEPTAVRDRKFQRGLLERGPRIQRNCARGTC